MVLTLALTAMLAASPAPTHAASSHAAHLSLPSAPVEQITVPAPRHESISQNDRSLLAIDLHPMTEEERQLYPGRERFDKTEWYESLFKSAKIVTMPEHVDEWHNGGIDAA